MTAKRWLLAACAAFLLASCQGPSGDYYVGRGGDGEDEAGTGRPQELIVGRWEPVNGDRKEAISLVQFLSGGAYHRMEQHRAGFAVSMAAGNYGQYQFLDDRTLELNLRPSKVKVAVVVTRDELVLTFPGKKPERFRRMRPAYGGIGTAAMRGSGRVRFSAPSAPRDRR